MTGQNQGSSTYCLSEISARKLLHWTTQDFHRGRGTASRRAEVFVDVTCYAGMDLKLTGGATESGTDRQSRGPRGLSRTRCPSGCTVQILKGLWPPPYEKQLAYGRMVRPTSRYLTVPLLLLSMLIGFAIPSQVPVCSLMRKCRSSS